jgi:hypothetical protein
MRTYNEVTAAVSAQIHRHPPANLQATALPPTNPDPVTKSQVTKRPSPWAERAMVVNPIHNADATPATDGRSPRTGAPMRT